MEFRVCSRNSTVGLGDMFFDFCLAFLKNTETIIGPVNISLTTRLNPEQCAALQKKSKPGFFLKGALCTRKLPTRNLIFIECLMLF